MCCLVVNYLAKRLKHTGYQPEPLEVNKMAEFKAQAHSRELKQRLSLQVSGLTVTEAFDSNGFPSLTLVKGSETIFVKISTLPMPSGRVDGLGLPQRAYSPHQVQILQDLDTISDKDLRAKTLAACGKLGMKLELWEKAALPSSFDLTGATLISTISSDEIHPLTMSQ
jgi:hypothetical protein